MPHRFSHGSSIVFRPGGGRKWNAVWLDPTVAKHSGRTTLKDGVGVLRVWRYGDGANYLPPKAGVKALRSAD